uniref:Homeobox domain-containing protein n=1 Tax=Kalanchoe fedtschenkoi TaxID=63787 RepID=A0A7N0V920_KALFE
MSPPPPPPPLDGRGLLLGLALRTAPVPPLGLSLSSTHDHHIISYDHQPSLTLSLLFPANKLDDYDDDQISSLSNSVNSVKRERAYGVANNNINDAYEDVSNNIIRKKLRLNKEQSALLEDSFKLQTTLHQKQKEALARQLNLLPRQVEVWFQNRRARTKLKQTEVDCEFLKRCCERLTNENERLRKELRALKQASQHQPFHKHLPTARLSMCPSCHSFTDLRNNPATASNNDISHPNFLTSSEKHILFNDPFVTKPTEQLKPYHSFSVM